jgi:LmbE family N-acetylglucosaminyl deacetylase
VGTGPRGASPRRAARWFLPSVVLTTIGAGLVGVPSALHAHGSAPDQTARASRGDARPADPLTGSWIVPRQPESGGGAAWTPSAPLPAVAATGERVDVVLSPHPDDETLSLGVWIANAVGRGDRVIVVSLTDGRTTGAVTKLSARLGHAVSRDEIAVARTLETRDAAAQLGVRPGDVYLAHLDGAGAGGTRATEGEVADVIAVFAARYPTATFATMSWAAERHPDHLSAGLALRAASAEGTVARAVFAISRLWWALPSPRAGDVLPVDPSARRRVLRAARAYDRWDPPVHRLAVGWTSVRPQFAALLADPRDRVHG